MEPEETLVDWVSEQDPPFDPEIDCRWNGPDCDWDEFEDERGAQGIRCTVHGTVWDRRRRAGEEE